MCALLLRGSPRLASPRFFKFFNTNNANIKPPDLRHSAKVIKTGTSFKFSLKPVALLNPLQNCLWRGPGVPPPWWEGANRRQPAGTLPVPQAGTSCHCTPSGHMAWPCFDHFFAKIKHQKETDSPQDSVEIPLGFVHHEKSVLLSTSATSKAGPGPTTRPGVLNTTSLELQPRHRGMGQDWRRPPQPQQGLLVPPGPRHVPESNAASRRHKMAPALMRGAPHTWLQLAFVHTSRLSGQVHAFIKTCLGETHSPRVRIVTSAGLF